MNNNECALKSVHLPYPIMAEVVYKKPDVKFE